MDADPPQGPMNPGQGSAAPVPSPCVKICRLVPLPDGGEFCAGCLRTPQEIMHWPVADDAWRREVWRRIALRRG